MWMQYNTVFWFHFPKTVCETKTKTLGFSFTCFPGMSVEMFRRGFGLHSFSFPPTFVFGCAGAPPPPPPLGKRAAEADRDRLTIRNDDDAAVACCTHHTPRAVCILGTSGWRISDLMTSVLPHRPRSKIQASAYLQPSPRPRATYPTHRQASCSCPALRPLTISMDQHPPTILALIVNPSSPISLWQLQNLGAPA